MQETIQILVVDRHLVVRKGFEVIFKAFDNIKLIGNTATLKEAIEICQSVPVDIILMGLYVSHEIQAFQSLIKHFSVTKIIAMIGFEAEAKIVQEIFEAGVKGLIHRGATIAEIRCIIHDVHHNHHAPAKIECSDQAKPSLPHKKFHLSQRQHDVLLHMSAGLTNKDIARNLTISPSTVSTHVRRILLKLGAKTRTEAVSIALHHRLVDKQPTQKD